MARTNYRLVLDGEAEVVVDFNVEPEFGLTTYRVVLVARDDGEWRAVRVYDNVHANHDMHRYTVDGVKSEAETFHSGTPSEAFNEARALVRKSYREMIDAWRP